MEFPAKPFFIFEMANNHMGSVAHGLRIIREFAEATEDFRDIFRLGFKFQYRDLDSFIHPDFKGRDDVKFVKRFTETRLDEAGFLELKRAADHFGFVSVCTPFDEVSVGRIEEHGFDVIKIASCSFTDWPLLERIAETSRPLIASVAGATLEDIDRVISFFKHRSKNLSLMHCVAEYPTGPEHAQLSQIDLLRARYPQTPVGFSTHERPDQTLGVQLAVAKGCTIFEKHVGVATDAFALNAYSASPAQARRWLAAAQEAMAMCGVTGARAPFSDEELSSLRSLRRGAFAATALTKGQRIARAHLTLAIPTVEGQLTANDLGKYVEWYAEADVGPGAPIVAGSTRRVDNQKKVYRAVQQVKALLKKSGVQVPPMLDLEISHHYGIDRFHEAGATIISFINRDYCKKVIVMLPGQLHPEQYHKLKEETFQLLYGKLNLTLDGESRECKVPDVVTIHREVKHSFSTTSGAIIEEISSTHFTDDSYYTDPAISANAGRKTLITYWMN